MSPHPAWTPGWWPGPGCGRTSSASPCSAWGASPAPQGSPDERTTEQDRQSEAERVLAEFVGTTLDGTSAPPVEQHAVHANVAPLLREVSTVAQQLVVGSRGRGGVADALLGSVSAELVNHAHCPVTVVPTGR